MEEREKDDFKYLSNDLRGAKEKWWYQTPSPPLKVSDFRLPFCFHVLLWELRIAAD